MKAVPTAVQEVTCTGVHWLAS